jgi:membrane protease YdiL (CAAX protease family)
MKWTKRYFVIKYVLPIIFFGNEDDLCSHRAGNPLIVAHVKFAKACDKWMSWPLVAALGLGWAAMSWLEYQSMLVEEVGVHVVGRYYDREIRLLDAGERAGSYGRWIAGTADKKEILQDLRDTIRNKYVGELGDEGERLLELLSLKLGKIEKPTEDYSDGDYRRELRSWLLAGHGKAWDYELFLQATGDRAVDIFYSNQNDRLLNRVVAMSAVFDLLALIGIICTIVLLIKKPPTEKPPTEKPPSRFPRKWSVRALLGGFFALNLLLLPWIIAVGTLYNLWTFIVPEDLAYLLYDLAWRAFPAAMLVLLFLKKPGNAWRVFGMRRPINWMLLLAVLGIMSLANFAIFQLAPPSESDPTDFMETVNPDLVYMLGLLFSIVIVAPIFEEIAFRGFLFQGLRSKIGNLQAGIISTLLFSLVHVQYDMWGLLSVATMGAGAAYLTFRTGSLKSAIVLHATINLLVTANVYYQYQLPL